MKTHNYLDIMLIRWAEALQRELDSSSYSKTSIVYRMMRMGPDGASIHSTTFQLPNYWPDAEIRAINESIWSMPLEYRNAIILTYVLRCSLSESGTQQKITKDQARHRLNKAKIYISHNLDSTHETTRIDYHV